MVKGVSARGGKACEMCGTWSRSTSSASLLLCFHVPTVSPSKAPAAKWWSELSGGGTLSLPGVPALASNKLAWEESVLSPLGLVPVQLLLGWHLWLESLVERHHWICWGLHWIHHWLSLGCSLT